MNITELINKKLLANGYNCEFIPSYATQYSNEQRSYLFHHIKKCGGMSIHSAINRAVDYGMKIKSTLPMITVRLDEHADWEDFFKHQQDIKTSLFISSHIAGDYYNDLGKNIKRLAVFRDPYDRAVSEYQYHCMRNRITPDTKEFSDYLFSERCLRDYISPFTLSNEQPSLLKIKDMLENDFESFFDTSVISQYLSYFLGENNLPNIIMNRQNTTMDKYKLPKHDDLRSLFYETNKLEKDLYDWVKAERKSPENKYTGNIHAFTVIINSTQTEDGYLGKSNIARTENLVKHITNFKSNTGLDVFFRS